MANEATQPLTTDADVLDDLDDIEQMAVELATLAGAEIVTTYGGIFTVRYKTGAAGALSSLRDPVSEIDRRVETLIRARLAERFPAMTSSARKWRSVLAAIKIVFGQSIRSTAPRISSMAFPCSRHRSASCTVECLSPGRFGVR